MLSITYFSLLIHGSTFDQMNRRYFFYNCSINAHVQMSRVLFRENFEYLVKTLIRDISPYVNSYTLRYNFVITSGLYFLWVTKPLQLWTCYLQDTGVYWLTRLVPMIAICFVRELGRTHSKYNNLNEDHKNIKIKQ